MRKKLFEDQGRNLRGLVLLVLAAGFVALLISLNQVKKPELVTTVGRNFERARVVEVVKDNLQEDGKRYGEQQVRLLMLTGPEKGRTVDATSSAGYLFGAGCTVGMNVITIQSVSGDVVVTSVYSADRELPVYIFVLLFFVALCLAGGRRGVKSSLGLLFTLGCIPFLYLPLIFRGFSPFWAAVLVAAVTICVTMYLIGGPTKKTACAIFGTVAGAMIAGAAASGFGYFSGISGYNVSDIENLLFLEENTGIQVGGLLFSSLLIASLGAVMDMSMSVCSAVEEIHRKSPEIGRLMLFRSGMNVGRDMMGTMSSTLILAFAGGSVSTLVTYYAYNLPYMQIINSYSIGIEIMQGLSGSIGVILTVPLAAGAAALLMGPQRRPDGSAAGEGAMLQGVPAAVVRSCTGTLCLLRRRWKLLVSLICAAALIFCGIRFYAVLSSYREGDGEYERARQSMAPVSASSEASAARPAAAGKRDEPFAFDLGKLRGQNGDAVGWIRLAGTKLSYPVVRGADNDYYLAHTFYKKENSMGAIFLDCRIGNWLSARNAILYGHNMRNGSMFAELCNFRRKDYWREHPSVELYTEKGKTDCPVFSAYETDPSGPAFTCSFRNEKSYGAYLEQIRKQSLYDTGEGATVRDRVLTLATCAEGSGDRRFVVHAKIPAREPAEA